MKKHLLSILMIISAVSYLNAEDEKADFKSELFVFAGAKAEKMACAEMAVLDRVCQVLAERNFI